MSRARSSRNGSRVTWCAARVTSRATWPSARRDARALGGELERALAKARVAEDLDVRGEKAGLRAEVEHLRAREERADRFLGDVERGAQHAHVVVGVARRREHAAARPRRRTTERGDRAEREAGDHGTTSERHLARAAARAARAVGAVGLLALRVDELRGPDAGGDERAEQDEELHLVRVERVRFALHHRGAHRARLAAQRDREKDRKARLGELVEMLVGCMRLRGLRDDRPHVLDRFARHALADREPDLTERRAREAHVAAHDELTLALEEVERADVGAEDRRDAARRFVEQREQRHRLRRERREVERCFEALPRTGRRDGLTAEDAAFGHGASCACASIRVKAGRTRSSADRALRSRRARR